MNKLGKKNTVLVSFMLFSLFFGAGNLIFPPFLGQMAGENMPIALLTFLITAVLLPVLGVLVVAKFGGLDVLAGHVNKYFAVAFTVIIYLAIGPGLGIPRAASVPFEMAIAPYLSQDAPLRVYMLLYSAVFFSVATWIALTPSKLVDRIGKVLTPSLLLLLVFLFISFVATATKGVAPAQGEYVENAAIKGFLEGYNTMDTIAALNFGFVIAATIQSLGVEKKSDMMKQVLKCGFFAGMILSLVYIMLSVMGAQTSGVYPVQSNGAWTLRCIVKDVFGEGGAIILALTFTLACLTTCIGLITSISQFFSTLFKKDYKVFVFAIALFSFVVCNFGLNTILSVSVPVLNIVYPVSIVLIALGLGHKRYENNKYVYPLTIGFTAVESIIYSVNQLVDPSVHWLNFLPLETTGLGWVPVALVAFCLALLIDVIVKKATKTETVSYTE